MLKTVTNYWKNKTIKLSDSFEVLITYPNNKEPQPLVNCTGFTIPKLEYEEEVLSYGNLSQVFQTPKYDSCKELALEFTEIMDSSKPTIREKNSVVLSKVFKYMGFETKQLFGNGELLVNTGTYTFDKIIPTIEIKILNNKLWRYNYLYHFENLKIVNYSIYSLDYQTESPCKVTVNLAFETYYKQVIDETVKYGDTVESKPVEQKEDTTPNGKVEVGNAKIEGNPNSHKEDIEQQWQQSINDSDLDMIRNEELLNPDLYELEDLDESESNPDLAMPQHEQEIDNTATSNNDVSGEPNEEDWRAKAYEAQQAAKGNRSPNLQQDPNPEPVENVKKNNQETANKSDPNELKKQLTKNDKMENIENQMKAKKDENSLLWEKHTENGETYTDKYIQTNNGHTVDATHNQQQYEATQRASEQKGQSMSRDPSMGTNGPGDTRSSSQEASNASNNAKQAADQREYQRKTDEYAKQNKGNRSAVPPAQNISVAQQTNDTESFYKNGA